MMWMEHYLFFKHATHWPMKTSSQPNAGSQTGVWKPPTWCTVSFEKWGCGSKLSPSCMAVKAKADPSPSFPVPRPAFLNFISGWKALCCKVFLESREPRKILLVCITLGKLTNFPQTPSPVPSAWRASLIWALWVCLHIFPVGCCIWDTISHLSLWKLQCGRRSRAGWWHISPCSSPKARPACCLPMASFRKRLWVYSKKKQTGSQKINWKTN